MAEEFLSPIDMLLDENNTENIKLFNEDNQEVEFEQIALIPVDEKVYAILRPLGGEEPLAEDEALVFAIEEVEDEDVLIPEENEEVVDAVFNKYYELLKEQGIDVEIVEE